MASVFKPAYTRKIPDGAKRCQMRAKSAVRYTDKRGKVHTRLMSKDGKRMICEQRCWWMKYRLPDGTLRRTKGYTDKTATEHEAVRRERKAAQRSAGVISVDERHLLSPVSEHIDAYLSDLERTGRTDEYRYILQRRMNKMASECEWYTLSSVQPSTMTRFLGKLKKQDAAPKTINEYLNAARAFLSWCVTQGRLEANPLENIARADQTVKKRKRRALTVEEAQGLLSVSGPRRIVYLVAINTGLRRSELADLQWDDIKLSPTLKASYISLRAESTKSHRADTIPLRADVSEELRNMKPKDAGQEDRVFDKIPSMKVFKKDLERAGIDFLDKMGRRIDFHCLRKTFGTLLSKSGVAPRTAMQLMRHTDMRLTMNVYTDPTLLNTVGAIESLPDLNGTLRDSNIALKTGTDDTPLNVMDSGLKKVLSKSSSCGVVLGHNQAKTDRDKNFADGLEANEMVPRTGFEPARDILPLGPEPSASANSATSAPCNVICIFVYM